MVGKIVEENSAELTIGAMADLAKIKRASTTLAATRAHFMAYRTADDVTMVNSKQWYDVSWNIAALYKLGFTHSDSSNPEQITVTNGGIYLVNYYVCSYTSNIVWAYVLGAQLLADGVLVPGSSWQKPRGYHTPVDVTFVASFSDGDILKLQTVSDYTNTKVTVTDVAYTPNPTYRPCATIMLVRID